MSGRGRFRAYLTLMRPANVITALADVLAGFAVAGFAVAGFAVAGFAVAGFAVAGAVPGLVSTGTFAGLAWLLLATAGLYAGGVVLNDVFDADLDARERPERPIPSGRASRTGAAVLGVALLAVGIAAAATVSRTSVALAAFIAVAAVFYDAVGKHRPFFGPINMGLCRGANLLLGVSVLPAMVASWWWLAVLPVAYIAAITAISRGEVHGGAHGTGVLAVALLAFVVGSLVGLGRLDAFAFWTALPFLALFVFLVAPPFVRAMRTPAPDVIRRAVRAGVLALIPLNATLGAGFGGWIFGLCILVLLPVSIGLARLFAVT